MVSWKTHSDVWAHITLRLFSGFSKIPSSVFFYWPAFMCTCSIYPPIIIIYCFSLPVILFQAAVSLQCFIFSPLYHLLCPIFLPSLHLKSSQFMQPKITTLPQRALQSVQHTTLSKQCLMTHTSILVYLQKKFWQLNNVNWLQMLFLGVQTKGKGRKIQKWKNERRNYDLEI